MRREDLVNKTRKNTMTGSSIPLSISFSRAKCFEKSELTFFYLKNRQRPEQII